MSTQLMSLSNQIFEGPRGEDVLSRTQSKAARRGKKLSTVDDFHREVFDIVQSSLKEPRLSESNATALVSDSNTMNSSENVFRERAEEVLEANTYTGSGSSEQNPCKKRLREVSDMMKKSSSKLSGSALKKEGIKLVRIRRHLRAR